MNTKATDPHHDLEDPRHRADCADCRQLWEELEQISAEASRLPLLTPSRDLWEGIETRISATPRQLPFYRKQAFRLALAASLLVAVSSGITWRLATDRSTAPDQQLAATVDGTDLHLASFSASVTEMEQEIAALQSIVSERRGELDPRTIAVLETNLTLIDTAIEESRAALASDPASRFLSAQFTRAYTSKLTLLRDVATLPTGI